MLNFAIVVALFRIFNQSDLIYGPGMTMWEDLRGGRCSMGDACSNPTEENDVFTMLLKNFNRHYQTNRAPFGLYYHSAWFNTAHHRKGFTRFMDEILSYGEKRLIIISDSSEK